MRILIIGDPHGDLDKIKKIPLKNIDLILLTGDFGKADLMRKMFFENINRQKHGLPKKKYSSLMKKRAFMEAYNSSIKLVRYLVKFAHVYAVFGNVESSNSETKKQAKKIGLRLPFLYDELNSMKNVKLIGSKIVNFRSIKIGGLDYFVDTGWVKDFNPENKKMLKSSKKQTLKAKNILRKFGKLDILLCHQPPYGILDRGFSKLAPKSWYGRHAGSRVIRDYILKNKPKYVFCGHMHESPGKKKLKSTEIYNLGFAGYHISKL